MDDAFKRLLKPSIETEFAALSKQKADEEAIVVFAETCASFCWRLLSDRNA